VRRSLPNRCVRITRRGTRIASGLPTSIAGARLFPLVPCLLGCLALTTPRLVVALLFLFSDYLGRAYETQFWPFLGFLFLPWTTLAYAVAMNQNHGHLGSWYLALYVLALLMDFGIVGFRKRARWGRRPPPGPGAGPAGGGPVPTAARSIDVRGERVG